MFLISIFIYKNIYYIHQYYSIIITLILGLIRFLFIRSYYSKIINNGTKFVLIFIFQILVSFFESLLIVYTKGLMEYKYFSPYKACYVFSLINSIIILICYIIISFIPCQKSYCTIKYKDKYYIDNILYFFNNIKIDSFIYLVIGSIITAIFKLLNNVTINKFTVCHLFLLFEAEDISNSIIDQLGSGINGLNFTIIFLCYIFQIIFILIFLEFIEIKFKNWNENTKKNIRKREKEEMILIEKGLNDDDSLCEEEEEKSENE